MEPEQRNSESRKLIVDPYSVLGIGYDQFQHTKLFLIKTLCSISLLMLIPLYLNLAAGPDVTSQGYIVPMHD